MYAAYLRPHYQVLIALAVITTSSLAQGQADPTRPAPAWTAAHDPNASADALANATSTAVQIVVVGPSRRFAVVNGQAVRPGELYNGSTLVAVEQGGVVWRKGSSQEKSSMNPSVQKTNPGADHAPFGDPNVRKKILNGGVK